MSEQGSTPGAYAIRKPTGPKATVTDLAAVRVARAAVNNPDALGAPGNSPLLALDEETEIERSSRVAELKAQVEAGTYEIDYYSVADKFTITRSIGQ